MEMKEDKMANLQETGNKVGGIKGADPVKKFLWGGGEGALGSSAV